MVVLLYLQLLEMPKRKQGEQEHDSDSDIVRNTFYQVFQDWSLIASREAQSIVDVDFEFFDPNPKVDYIALKRLLQQLFHADAALFQLHELADLILSQPLIGTTIKTDGIESDPLAFLTVLNLHTHKVSHCYALETYLQCPCRTIPRSVHLSNICSRKYHQMLHLLPHCNRYYETKAPM